MKQDLLSLDQLSKADIQEILKTAAVMKKNRLGDKDVLVGKSIGLLFQKPSNRTRVSFEVGIQQMGGYCLYLSPEEINLGKRESVADVAKTLSRYLDAIVARTFSHDDLIELAREASVPIINGLSDLYHPCQALADLMTVEEKFGSFNGRTLTYIGDGNNVCHSLLLGCSLVGLNMTVSAPAKYQPDPGIFQKAVHFGKVSGARILMDHDPAQAVRGAHILYSDVWVSMGQEEETRQRLEDFKGYQINEDLAALADPGHIIMHCLPAHRGQEVTAGVIDGPHAVIFDQAENRLHVEKAVLKFLMGEK